MRTSKQSRNIFISYWFVKNTPLIWFLGMVLGLLFSSIYHHLNASSWTTEQWRWQFVYLPLLLGLTSLIGGVCTCEILSKCGSVQNINFPSLESIDDWVGLHFIHKLQAYVIFASIAFVGFCIGWCLSGFLV